MARRRFPILLAAMLAGVLACCSGSREDDANWTHIVWVSLLPRDAETPDGADLRALDGPHWIFRLPRGYLTGSDRATTLISLKALFPTMEHFVPQRRAAWFRRRLFGGWGAHTDDVIRVWVQYERDGVNDAGVEAEKAQQRFVGTSEYSEAPPAGVFDTVTEARLYRFVSDRSKAVDVNDGRATLVYTQSAGRRVAIMLGEWWRVRTTWRGRLRVEYDIFGGRKHDFREIDLAVQRLLDSIQPTFVP